VAWELEHRHYLPYCQASPSNMVPIIMARLPRECGQNYTDATSKSPSLLSGVSGTHSAILRF
jgi:hypothetical protein